jgi:hypothetical protein
MALKTTPVASPNGAALQSSGRSGGVAAGTVVDDEVGLDLVPYGLVDEFCRVLDHFRIQHSGDHFIKREGFGIGFFIAHPPLPSPWQTASAEGVARSIGPLRNTSPHSWVSWPFFASWGGIKSFNSPTILEWAERSGGNAEIRNWFGWILCGL